MFPSIIRSSKLRIQQRYMSNSCCYLLQQGAAAVNSKRPWDLCMKLRIQRNAPLLQNWYRVLYRYSIARRVIAYTNPFGRWVHEDSDVYTMSSFQIGSRYRPAPLDKYRFHCKSALPRVAAVTFLGAFTAQWQSTVRFCLFPCEITRLSLDGFHEIRYLNFFFRKYI